MAQTQNIENGEFLYSVTWRKGSYRYAESKGINQAYPYYVVWREAGHGNQQVGFAFTETEAKRICLAMEIIDSYIGGEGSRTAELLTALDKVRV